MRSVAEVKNLKRYRDRNGTLRLYHRPSGTALKSEYGSAAFFAELDALNAKHEAKTEAKPAKGTLLAVMEEYRQSAAFTGLAAATRAGYERYFTLIPSWHQVAVRGIASSDIAKMRDKLSQKHGRRSANYVLAVLSILFGFAVEQGHATTNPVRDVKRVRRPKNTPRANRPWLAQECRIVIERAAPQIRLPVALCMFTGMRKRDALTIGPAAIEGRTLRFVTSKTEEEVTVPMHPVLASIVQTRPFPAAPTLATTSRGEPWTNTGFDTGWQRFKDGLEAEAAVGPDLTMHGLRHTVGGLLADADCDLDTIRRVLGQKTLVMAQHYSERAQRAKATRQAIEGIGSFWLDNQPGSPDLSTDG